jgi:hypothetical protein
MAPDGKFGVKTATKHTQLQKSELTACPVARPLLSAAAIAALAQLVEHIIRNDGVTCSSHVSGTSLSWLSSDIPIILPTGCTGLLDRGVACL